jgi:hypothetical protein
VAAANYGLGAISRDHGDISAARARFQSCADIYRENGDLATAFLGSDFNIDAPAARKVYADALKVLTPDGEIALDKVREVLNMGREAGQPRPEIDKPESLVDFSFVREARRSSRR